VLRTASLALPTVVQVEGFIDKNRIHDDDHNDSTSAAAAPIHEFDTPNWYWLPITATMMVSLTTGHHSIATVTSIASTVFLLFSSCNYCPYCMLYSVSSSMITTNLGTALRTLAPSISVLALACCPFYCYSWHSCCPRWFGLRAKRQPPEE